MINEPCLIAGSVGETAAQIGATIGALVAAASLGAGFWLYRINRRDDEVADLRMTIAAYRANLDRLMGMVGYELADELATAAVYSRSMQVPIARVYDAVFRASPPPVDPEEDIKEILGKITVAIDSPIASRYEEAVGALASDIARYQSTYPGMYRVLQSQAGMYANVLRAEKSLIRDEDQWAKTVVEIASCESKSITGLAELKHALLSRLVQSGIYLSSEFQKDLRDFKEIFEMVADAYMSHDERGLVRISRKERGEDLTPVSETETLPEDLREAEVALRHLLSQDECLRYRELVTSFEARRED